MRQGTLDVAGEAGQRRRRVAQRGCEPPAARVGAPQLGSKRLGGRRGGRGAGLALGGGPRRRCRCCRRGFVAPRRDRLVALREALLARGVEQLLVPVLFY